MMPTETLALGLADATRQMLSSRSRRSPQAREGRTPRRAFLAEIRRQFRLTVRPSAEPWMPRVSANYPY